MEAKKSKSQKQIPIASAFLGGLDSFLKEARRNSEVVSNPYLPYSTTSSLYAYFKKIGKSLYR